MPMTAPRTAALVLLASLWLVSSCANKVPVQNFPPRADLAVEAKPILTADALASDKALNDHEVAVEAWGTRGWLAVARLCRWAQDTGAPGLDCPKAP